MFFGISQRDRKHFINNERQSVTIGLNCSTIMVETNDNKIICPNGTPEKKILMLRYFLGQDIFIKESVHFVLITEVCSHISLRSLASTPDMLIWQKLNLKDKNKSTASA